MASPRVFLKLKKACFFMSGTKRKVYLITIYYWDGTTEEKWVRKGAGAAEKVKKSYERSPKVKRVKKEVR